MVKSCIDLRSNPITSRVTQGRPPHRFSVTFLNCKMGLMILTRWHSGVFSCCSKILEGEGGFSLSSPFLRFYFLSHLYTSYGAQTYSPKIDNCVLHQLSRPGALKMDSLDTTPPSPTCHRLRPGRSMAHLPRHSHVPRGACCQNCRETKPVTNAIFLEPLSSRCLDR